MLFNATYVNNLAKYSALEGKITELVNRLNEIYEKESKCSGVIKVKNESIELKPKATWLQGQIRNKPYWKIEISCRSIDYTGIITYLYIYTSKSGIWQTGCSTSVDVRDVNTDIDTLKVLERVASGIIQKGINIICDEFESEIDDMINDIDL